MRTALLAATLSLLLPAKAFSQTDYSSAVAPSEQTCTEPCGPPTVKPTPFRASGEFLLWWFDEGESPPLVAVGGNGTAGSPRTQTALEGLDFEDTSRKGARFVLGYNFESAPRWGLEVNGFFITPRTSDVTFSSTGEPVLGRPFFNILTGQPDLTLIAFPDTAAGSITVAGRSSLWGLEANLVDRCVASDQLFIRTLGGFRFLSFSDELTLSEQFRVAPGVPGFGGSAVQLWDRFQTSNRFYGGQLGFEAGVQQGSVTIDIRAKFALGVIQQGVDIDGSTHVQSPSGSTADYHAGFLALPTNIGSYDRARLAFIPELNVNFGMQMTTHAKVFVGYSILYVSTVARAGDQIDPAINVTQYPILSPGPLTGPARPGFSFEGTSFWAQGVSFGIELRF